MKKTLVAIALIGLCQGVNAKSEVCNYATDYNVNIDANKVVFDKKTGEKYEFVGDKLLINNKPVALTKDQQKASADFAQGARTMVPKVAKIAVEGAELGIKAATMVMTSLFGNDPAMQAELIAPIEKLTDKIKQNITETSFNAEVIEDSVEKAFDDEFEKMFEIAITKYSGKIVGNVLSSLFSGDSEEIEDLEFRMENLERDIDTYVETNAKELELRANALCEDMVALDAIDNALIGVAGYPKNGLITQEAKEIKLNDVKLTK